MSSKNMSVETWTGWSEGRFPFLQFSDPVPHWRLKNHDHSDLSSFFLLLQSPSTTLGPYSFCGHQTPDACISLPPSNQCLSTARINWWNPPWIQANIFSFIGWNVTFSSNIIRCPGAGSFPSSSDCSHFWECLGEDQVSKLAIVYT